MSALPERGVAAHRGGNTAPENTLAAFRDAVRLGAAMVELDLRRTADGAVVVMHDRRVDRTTDGEGAVCELRLAEIRRLEVRDGPRSERELRGAARERVPTLEEVLDWAPPGVWLELQIKHGETIGRPVARAVAARGLVDRVVVACGDSAARDVRTVHPAIRIANLRRGESREAYLAHGVATRADFIQTHHARGLPERAFVDRVHAAGLRLIHFAHPETPRVAALWEAGVDFVLVDDVAAALRAIAELGERGAV